MMKDSVNIRGDGIAARCCGHLLRLAGITTVADPGSRPSIPAILLADSALMLIRDVFGDTSLFRSAPHIRNRVVQWKRSLAAATLPHSAVVVSERELLQTLEPDLIQHQLTTSNSTLYASRPLPPEAMPHSFGSRSASGLRVSLQPLASPHTCWIESLPEGWLFLLPGWLLSVGSSPDQLLGQSTLIAAQIHTVHESAGTFPAYPRIASPLFGPEWMACGTAAMAFDPLCGDGTAHAVREGILAAAVLQSNLDRTDLARHYDARLTAGFARHLALCRDFYQSGYGGPWWDEQVESTNRGLAWCAQKLEQHGPFRYRLNGYKLEPLVT